MSERERWAKAYMAPEIERLNDRIKVLVDANKPLLERIKVLEGLIVDAVDLFADQIETPNANGEYDLEWDRHVVAWMAAADKKGR